jgi:hypothetical protein
MPETPEIETRVFIVIDVYGRPKSVAHACESLMDEISTTLQVLRELQRHKYPNVVVYQTQVSPAGAQT